LADFVLATEARHARLEIAFSKPPHGVLHAHDRPHDPGDRSEDAHDDKGDDDCGQDGNGGQNRALPFDGRRFQGRVAQFCELDDLVDRGPMRAIGFGHLQIGVVGGLGVSSLDGRKKRVLHGLPEIPCRLVGRFEKLIAQSEREVLPAPERVALVEIRAKLLEALAAGLKAPGLLDDRRRLEEGLDHIGRWRHNIGNEVLAVLESVVMRIDPPHFDRAPECRVGE
jgi:hypothetical protein